MDKQAAVEMMATCAEESISIRAKGGPKDSYKEICSIIYDAMDEQGLILKP
jgi:hypothetical protein